MRRDHGEHTVFYETQEAPDGRWWLLAFVVRGDRIESHMRSSFDTEDAALATVDTILVAAKVSSLVEGRWDEFSDGMCIHAGVPIDSLRAALTEHLPAVFIAGEQLAQLREPGTAAEPLAFCFKEKECVSQMPTADLGSNKRVKLQGKTRSFYAVAIVAPLVTTGELLLLLLDDYRLLLAIQTDISRRDGIVQLYGDKGVMLMTAEEHAAQKGQTLLNGETLHSFTLQERNDSDEWVSLVPPSVVVDSKKGQDDE